ncbi:MAG: hypothetical protein JWL93_2735 [Hyphomicrobiales bacterium]|nr:hypothetical protein [Hyphomicrobiales bacterium]
MATLVLQAAGAALGTALGGPVGAIVGRAIGAAAGSAIDQRLFGGGRHTEGPRLEGFPGLASTEGAPIPRVYGRARIGGQVIWATRFIETAATVRAGSSGGKSSGNASTTYRYAANFAVGLCEGEIAFVRRIWADGRELDLDRFTIRIYPGSQTQEPDALIVAREGADSAPAYRGLAYVVFEQMPLADFGNRIPQLSFEVVRPVHGLCRMIRAVDIIPGASEFAYSVRPLVQNVDGVTAGENRHQLSSPSDWTGSLDALQALCPNLQNVALVVSWFGDDLRAGHCSFAPRVETRNKTVAGANWSVAGLSRGTARVISQVGERPAYGGTPSDETVAAAIRDLRARGLRVLFYPFVMMDIPAGNSLPDPRTGAPGQRTYPWRGELTCAAADDTAEVRQEIATCFGNVSPGDDEWSFRRMVLHYAGLCSRAGGVDAFLVGSEMRGLTPCRDATGAYPAAQQFARLAGDVRQVLGPSTKISYAADWTEYGAHVRDGGADVSFPLDVVWSHPAVDFVGIDLYFPLSDWRNSSGHADHSLAGSVYDRDYLTSRFGAGEAYDFYYANDAARQSQQRTAISDGAYDEPWLFRPKDLVNWWSRPHHARVAGIRSALPSGWMPRSKPIWFIEAGCPAVDLGANAPNVFPDVHAPGENLPPFSSGARDDLMQVRTLEALFRRFDPRVAGHDASWNPASDVYAGRMVDPDRIYVWAYDARPFPAFPMLGETWTDAAAWDTGHWLNGRLEAVPLDSLLQAVLQDLLGDDDTPLPMVDGMAEGYVIDRPVSARGALEPLAAWFGFDAVSSGAAIRFVDRRGGSALRIDADDLVPLRDGSLVERTRAEESELPRELSLTFSDSEFDYRPASVTSRRLEGGSRRVASAELPLTIHRAAALVAADVWLRDLWVARETVRAVLRPGFAALEVGDLVSLPAGEGERLYRILRLTDADAREIHARAVDLRLHDRQPVKIQRRPVSAPVLAGPARIEVLDLAIAADDASTLHYVAAFASPWRGPLSLWRASPAGSFEQLRQIEQPAMIGRTLDVFASGPLSIFDRASSVRIALSGGNLSSASDEDVLAGRNRLALRGVDGQWEILGFGRAQVIAAGTWQLSRFLRGLGGQDMLAGRTTPAGATVVVLDAAIVPLASGLASLGIEHLYRVGPADRDHADASYVEFAARAGPLALRPYAPVQARAKRVAAGVEIAFVRRGRRDGDGWETVEIPLGEERERYCVEVLRGADLCRAIPCTQPIALYSAEAEAADFGSPQTHLTCRIYQLSDSVGAGFPLAVELRVQ